MNIKWVGAHPNNFQTGRDGKQIKYIVCHWIVGTLASADITFQNPQRLASATYGVGGEEIHQYVKEEDTAFANGNYLSNQESISIEHEGGPTLPISEKTYDTSAKLVAHLAKKYNIPLNRNFIKKHNEVSDKPTQCPGYLDIDKIIAMAEAYNTQIPPIPNPFPDDRYYLMSEVVKRLYKGLTGEWGNDTEIRWRVQSGVSIDDIIDDIGHGDSRFRKKWIEPNIPPSSTTPETPSNSPELEKANQLINQLRELLYRKGSWPKKHKEFVVLLPK